jgi:hypothetical protein
LHESERAARDAAAAVDRAARDAAAAASGLDVKRAARDAAAAATRAASRAIDPIQQSCHCSRASRPRFEYIKRPLLFLPVRGTTDTRSIQPIMSTTAHVA